MYGWNALVRWNAIGSTFWKVAAAPPIILLFLVLLMLLMAAISALVRKPAVALTIGKIRFT